MAFFRSPKLFYFEDFFLFHRMSIENYEARTSVKISSHAVLFCLKKLKNSGKIFISRFHQKMRGFDAVFQAIDQVRFIFRITNFSVNLQITVFSISCFLCPPGQQPENATPVIFTC